MCLAWLCPLFVPAFGLGAKDPIDACEVFRHPDQFDGKTIQIRGVYLGHTHATYFRGYPKCEGEFLVARVHDVTFAGGTIKEWRAGGGRLGVWMLCDMTGKFWRNVNGGYEFDAVSLTVLRRVEPYDVPRVSSPPSASEPVH